MKATEGWEGKIPTMRTVQRLLKDVVVKEDPHPWDWQDSSDPQFMLEVLAQVVLRTEGWRQHLSASEAQQLEVIHHASSDIPPFLAYLLARYLMSETDGGGPRHDIVGLALAFAPWRSEYAFSVYLTALAGETLTDNEHALLTVVLNEVFKTTYHGTVEDANDE